jgi:aryl-alcohol dehydrogenase-like predicted oxidoreductase
VDFTKKRVLGRTGLEVSRLGLASGYGIPAAGVERAFHEYGINYFYWSTPRRSGMRDGLRNLVKANRENIVIVLQTYDHLGLTIRRSVIKGLKTLGTDHVDAVLLGWHNRRPFKKIIDEALVLKEQGLIRFIAMSGHSRSYFGKIAQTNDPPVDIFMLRYNAAHTGAEEDIFPHLPKDNCPGVTIYTATRWGKLLNPKKMPADEKPLSAAECYRFVLSNPHVDLCMMGSKNEQQMLEGLIALQQGPLSPEEMAHIRKIGEYVHG